MILVMTNRPCLGAHTSHRYGGYPYGGDAGYEYGGGSPVEVAAEVECMDVVKEHPLKHRQEMEGMDMVEDTTTKVDVEVVEIEHEGVVLEKHWICDVAERHQQTHQERELEKSGY
jgi:hypothetical protein